ncbi:peptidylprolyl isomerase [Caulobacter ginsengisoli]|uniref:peptidylprolyl isomerase n=1 Tax=Caulobacter ginsengisoli TaxID=400775 RepID=A0ABU0IPK6_9CAUL|nr:peptidylprolyl isomerase [Caulobacter ginsengisoli]MDQ0463943.1 peptidylprolyl isomerase [Caulobacter ginsengisoli]
MKPVLLAALLATIATPVFAAPLLSRNGPAEADWRTPNPENVLVIDTNKGRIIVELVPEVAPAHVARLRELTRKGTYDGRTFFRVIDRFMDQTGDPKDTGDGGTDLPNLKAEFTFRRDAKTPFALAASPQGAELGFIGPLPIYSQAWSYSEMTSDHRVSAWGTYCPGVVGMARDDDIDSANSQFFLMRWAYPSLDKRYTAFGRVIDGLGVVRAIKTGEPVPDPQDRMLKVRVLADIPEGERPKIRVIDPTGKWFAGEIKRMRKSKGADFSPCDLDIPTQINGETN